MDTGNVRRHKSRRPLYKRIFDIVFSLLALSLLAPLFLLIPLLIVLEDGGPIFFVQERVGRNGRHFSCLKFRTMVAGAEGQQRKLRHLNEVTGPVFKIRNDPRVTRVGRFLRKSSLDELPQFFNVLKGEMSVVGPRPPVPEEVALYQPHYLKRLSVKPGLTCIWQVSGRNAVPFEKWMEMDIYYVEHANFQLDIKLILKTIWVILKMSGC